MNEIRTRLHVAPNGTISRRPPHVTPPRNHDAAIFVATVYPPRPLPADATARVRAIKEQIARLLVLDPRTPDEIHGYGKDGPSH